MKIGNSNISRIEFHTFHEILYHYNRNNGRLPGLQYWNAAIKKEIEIFFMSANEVPITMDSDEIFATSNTVLKEELDAIIFCKITTSDNSKFIMTECHLEQLLSQDIRKSYN